MLQTSSSAAEKRRAFRRALATGKLLRFPGAFSPLVAMLVEQIGFDGVYVSGAVVSANLGLPDVGLTTLSEVADQAGAIARVTNLPAIVDIDTGFGEPTNVARTVQTIEEAGLCGCHLEDQTMPKRCGHLDNKQLVGADEMVGKLRAAVEAKQDANFLVVARTDARGVEGLEAAIDRARRYVDAGAEMIFPEALADQREFEAFRQAIDVPLLANMTEFGKSRLLGAEELEQLGYNLVIYPVTSLRLAMKGVEEGLRTLLEQGTQQSLLDSMQTRQQLYELLQYDAYSKFDQEIYNFRNTLSD